MLLFGVEPLIWQPRGVYQPSYDFGILVDAEFARRMIVSSVGLERGRGMKEMALETIGRFGFSCANPLEFYKESALATQFSIGTGGTWLAIFQEDKAALLDGNLEGHVRYDSHNVDAPKKAYALMALVDLWAEYAVLLTIPDI